MHWILDHLWKEWKTLKSAPLTFVASMALGALAVHLYYACYRIPVMADHIGLLQDRLSATDKQSSKDGTPSVNRVADTRQAIRTFLESISPRILDKVDAKDRNIGVWLGSTSEAKLNELSGLAGFADYLSFEKGDDIWIVFGPGTGKEEYKGLIRGVGEKGQLSGYRLHPKDALMK